MRVEEQPLSGCPLCGEARREPLFAKDGWPIARCPACGLVYVDAALDRAAIEAIYGPDYYAGEAFGDYLGERDARLASGRARVELLASLVGHGRLLDVGCAAGFFLHAASERYEVTGVEVSAFAAQYAREQFGLPVFTGELADAPLEPAAFDVVTLWDVVEHVRDPRAVLDEVARVTRPGGVLALTTGNVEGPLARRDLRRWDLMHPPGHLLFFSPRTLERLLNDTGFEVERLVFDGLASTRPRLRAAPARTTAAALGLGNVMTAFARRSRSPRRHPVRARVPAALVPRAPFASPRPRPADDATWHEIAAASPDATFFHTPMWRTLALEGTDRCADASFLLELPSGVRAVFPLQELLPRPGRARYLQSTYPYGFGGPVADGTLTTQDLRRLYGWARAGTTSVTGNPRAGVLPDLPGWSAQALTTQTLDLRPGYEELRRRFSKGHRAAIAQAERKGVTTRTASSLADYRAYHGVYEDSLRRWGDAAGVRYPWSLFEAGWRLAERHPEAMQLWLAEHDGDVVSGAWIFSWNGHVMYWHAATLERAFALRPANLLLARAIADACARGCREFDFGSSGGHAGPEAFKRRFGATERPLPVLRHVAPAVRASAAARGAVQRARSASVGREG